MPCGREAGDAWPCDSHVQQYSTAPWPQPLFHALLHQSGRAAYVHIAQLLPAKFDTCPPKWAPRLPAALHPPPRPIRPLTLQNCHPSGPAVHMVVELADRTLRCAAARRAGCSPELAARTCSHSSAGAAGAVLPSLIPAARILRRQREDVAAMKAVYTDSWRIEDMTWEQARLLGHAGCPGGTGPLNTLARPAACPLNCVIYVCPPVAALLWC